MYDPCGKDSRGLSIHELTLGVANLSARALEDCSSGGSGMLDLAAHWLAKCRADHTQCSKVPNKSWYPTRLLDIRSEAVRLIETATEPPKGPYATLKQTKAEFLHGRPLHDFPPTHREALLAAKYLGIDYVWIDCYCILQSEDHGAAAGDKAYELSQMQHVYANSMLNIGATGAEDAYSGCSGVRYRDGGPERVRIENKIYQITDKCEKDPSMDLYKHAKLFTRGWVMQERLLAPRMLHLAGSQTFWECSETRFANARFPGGLEQTAYPSSPGYPFCLQIGNFPPSLHPLLASLESLEWNRLWRGVVERYSCLALSHVHEDKFAAIGAVAERLAKLNNDVYIAGLFKRFFCADLCWSNEFGAPRAKRWRAPSWSWASLNILQHSKNTPSYPTARIIPVAL
ncbi:hypothetical protein BAUCODRAFT_28186 [Baudoinia panamericana UAMH 10762]|uniref:Heterokaryon incompatibility domain-containing protein n=1 Tax=Baudoinia panamericana (strain UAMH 10762) TaxID=717646 RepID=M2N080_BAUPA|nr:uncharacterized protein BAUCODRAFT_28186 [Baudoinia panamericana UAMH 10762]EMC91975.1 hypothetical protein BAUCODRAFT_28186 [Baudoinia panamericana UAMH 10762]